MRGKDLSHVMGTIHVVWGGREQEQGFNYWDFGFPKWSIYFKNQTLRPDFGRWINSRTLQYITNSGTFLGSSRNKQKTS